MHCIVGNFIDHSDSSEDKEYIISQKAFKDKCRTLFHYDGEVF